MTKGPRGPFFMVRRHCAVACFVDAMIANSAPSPLDDPAGPARRGHRRRGPGFVQAAAASARVDPGITNVLERTRADAVTAIGAARRRRPAGPVAARAARAAAGRAGRRIDRFGRGDRRGGVARPRPRRPRGPRPFGRGSIQTIMPLQSGGAMKLTTTYYVAPSGSNCRARARSPMSSSRATTRRRRCRRRWARCASAFDAHRQRQAIVRGRRTRSSDNAPSRGRRPCSRTC